MPQGDKLAELFAKPLPRESAAVRFVRPVLVAEGLGALLGMGVIVSGTIDVFGALYLAALTFVVREAVRAFRGNFTSLRRMEWVLLAQVPWVNLKSPAFHYDNYLLLDCTFRMGNAAEPLELGVGTRLEAYAGTAADPAYLGINLVALLFLEVLRRARSSRTAPARTL